MLTLPDAIVSILIPFATLFSNPTWRKAQVLLVGAILTPGQRTVAAVGRRVRWLCPTRLHLSRGAISMVQRCRGWSASSLFRHGLVVVAGRVVVVMCVRCSRG